VGPGPVVDPVSPNAQVQTDLRPSLDAVIAEQEDRARGRQNQPSMRDHDVTALTAGELDRARRELQASLALVWPDSPARVPILAHMSAIDQIRGTYRNPSLDVPC
jgi:hypothetical protein